MKEEISHHDKLEKYKKESELQQEKRTLDLVKNSMLNKRDLARLLDYYRMVIDAYEKERVNNLNLLESIKVSNELIHKVDFELRLLVVSFPHERTMGFLGVAIIKSKNGISIKDSNLKITKTEIKATATLTDWQTVEASEDVWF